MRCQAFLPILVAVLSANWCIAQQSYPTTAPADEAGQGGQGGFESIFDGKSLAGWDGAEKFWRVEGGAIVGEITPGNEIKRNTFIIWRGGERGGTTGDFELKLQYRISGKGNSGINYRSVEMDDAKFALCGYQFDIDGGGEGGGGRIGGKPNAAEVRHTGNNYEERGRTFMAVRGQVVRAVKGGQREIVGAVGEYTELARLIRKDDWNDVHIIARGNTMVHLLNGKVMCVLLDDDAEHRMLEGKLGVQVHTGPPMKVEFREIRLMRL
jgi:hypothetical protein